MNEEKPKLPQEFFETGLALAQSATMFGVALMELSREELLAVAAQLGHSEVDLRKQLQAARQLTSSLMRR